MSALRPECRRLLETAGFTYSESVHAWCNVSTGHALAFDAAATRSRESLIRWLGAEVSSMNDGADPQMSRGAN